MESERDYNRLVDKVAEQFPGRRATIKYMLKNKDYKDLLYTYSENCHRCDVELYQGIKQSVIDAYHNWENEGTRNCVSKHGLRNKEYFPEIGDINRLTEAVVNTRGGERAVTFVTNDAHFLCHIDSIKEEFGVSVLDYRKI